MQDSHTKFFSEDHVGHDQPYDIVELNAKEYCERPTCIKNVLISAMVIEDNSNKLPPYWFLKSSNPYGSPERSSPNQDEVVNDRVWNSAMRIYRNIYHGRPSTAPQMIQRQHCSNILSSL